MCGELTIFDRQKGPNSKPMVYILNGCIFLYGTLKKLRTQRIIWSWCHEFNSNNTYACGKDLKLI